MKRIYSLILFLIMVAALSLGVTAGAAGYRFNMSYIYFGNSSGYTALVDATQDSLNEVAPNYFTLNETGELVVTGAYDRDFVDDMHARGIRVVPYLSNDWKHPEYAVAALKGLDDPSVTDTLVDKLVAFIDDKGLDGINIDLENLRAEQSADYIRLMQQLWNRLHPEGKTVAVAVAAKPDGHETAWSASYDYAELAKYCDYLMIMAYDESYYGSEPGPVASYAFVDNSVKYAVSRIPKDKIVLGLPFYGRIWADGGDGWPDGYGIKDTDIARLLDTYGGSETYDTASRSVRAAFTVKASDVKPVVGGTTLDAGTYVIWYDNERTLKEKLALVKKYDLKGTGSWSLGQETADTWDYYKLWLNGCTFGDIQTSWARDYVLTAYMNGWVNGMSAETFAPDAGLTRAQAATMLVRRLGLPAEANAAYSFDDTSGNWAEAYINTARKNGIINGVGDNLFAPDRPVTREEIAVMLNNILRYTCSETAGVFSDVSGQANPWSYEAIFALSENDVITGYPDGSFHPRSTVTRAEMTALMCRVEIA